MLERMPWLKRIIEYSDVIVAFMVVSIVLMMIICNR